MQKKKKDTDYIKDTRIISEQELGTCNACNRLWPANGVHT